MLLHLLGIFEDLQSFDRTCSKEPDQITVLCDVHQDEVFQCMYPQSSRCVIIDLFDDLVVENMEFCFASFQKKQNNGSVTACRMKNSPFYQL